MNALTLLRAQNRVLSVVAPTWAARRGRDLFLTPRRIPPPRREESVAGIAEPLTLPSGLVVSRWGAAGRPRAVLLHGWEGRPTQFGPIIAELGVDFEVLGVHAPAHGDSPGQRANPVAFAAALSEVDQAFGPFAVAVGHSMGAGAVVLALTEGLRAERAVLISSPSSIEGVCRRFCGFVGLQGAAVDRFFTLVEREVGRPATGVSIEGLGATVDTLTLVVHDQGDREVPIADGRAVANALPSGRLFETQGLGHRRILRDRAVVEAVAAFCRS